MIDPAYLSIPSRVGSYGDEAIDLAERAGRVLDEEQRLGVDALLSYGAGGRWTALESAILEARQNGKTAGILLPVTLFDLFLMPPDRIVWTAHLFKTSRDAFEDFETCIATSPDLSRRVKQVNHGRGEESIELHSGAKLEFLARSKGGGRGLGGKRVVMDEALFLAASAMGALMPTLSARPDPQINYGSSGAFDTSDHLHRLKDRGRSGKDPSLIWVEWCAPGSWEDPPCEAKKKCSHMPGTPGCALDDEERWKKANHTLGKRITISYVRAERLALPPIEFGRERLGWHQPPSEAGKAISAEQWARLLDGDSRRVGDVALAVDISPTRDYAAIALWGRREDGLGHGMIVAYKPGTDWVLAELVRWRDQLNPVGIGAGRQVAASLKGEAFDATGIRVPNFSDEPEYGDLVVLNSTDMAAATSQILDAVKQETFRHLGQRELDASVQGAKTKVTDFSELWVRKDLDSDTSPIGALTFARWVFESRAHLARDANYDVLESVY
ncbi:hypothetical protein ACWEF6_02650 [Amycolatopsis sp. NPDC004772]